MKFKKPLSLLLGVAMTLSLIIPSFAEPLTAPAKLTAEAVVFNVEVPTGLPVHAAADGAITVANDAKIVNNSAGPIFVANTSISAAEGWSLVDYATANMAAEKVGTKKLALNVNVTEAALVGKGGTAAVIYDAKLPAQKDALSMTAANVLFTVGWDSEQQPITVIQKGSCGDNILFTLTSDGILNLVGTGDVAEYSYYEYVPWYANRMLIKKVIMDDRITSFGNDWAGNFIQGCDNVEEIHVSESVTILRSYVFDSLINLKVINIPSSVTEIGSCTFSQCKSLTLTIPDTVTSIGRNTFYKVPHVYYTGSATYDADNLYWGADALN